MKTEEQLNEDIIKVRTTIKEKYPELVKYLNEMPVPLFDNEASDNRIIQLRDYQESLLNLVMRYSKSHKETTPNRNGI